MSGPKARKLREPHPLDGVFDFEFLRRQWGDQAAEEALLIEYRLKDLGGGRSNVGSDGIDFGHRNRVDVCL